MKKKSVNGIRITVLLLNIIGMLLLCSCGSNKEKDNLQKTHGTGAISIRLSYPENQSKIIPLNTQSYSVELTALKAINAKRKEIVSYPNKSISFNELLATTYIIAVLAYDGLDATGEVVAYGFKDVEITMGETTSVSITLVAGTPPTQGVSNGHYYALFEFTSDYTWAEAKEYCENIGGHLVTITSEDEQNFIWSLIQSGKKQIYFIGLHRKKLYDTSANVNEWAWVTGEDCLVLGEPEGYNNWDTLEPNNYQGREYYGMMYNYLGVIGRWNDTFDNAGNLGTRGFICEFDNPVN